MKRNSLNFSFHTNLHTDHSHLLNFGLETVNRGVGKSDCVTGRIISTRPVHNHLLPTPRLTVSYLTIQYQTTFLWMGFCEI